MAFARARIAALAGAPVMALAALIGAAALVALALAAPAAAATFGDDTRRLVPAEMKHLESSVGLLFNNSARSVCTAFCVAPNIVATAGHCLFRTAGERPPDVNRFVFALRPSRLATTTRIAGSLVRAARQNVLAGGSRLSIAPPIDATKDWALVRLERPACKGSTIAMRSLSPAEIADAAAAKKFVQVAFHRDYSNWQLAYSEPCAAPLELDSANRATIARDFAGAGELVLHTCDTGGASSGSPLLMLNGTQLVAVGINVGTYVQTRLMMRDGEVIRRFKAEPIANTGVTLRRLAAQLPLLENADILSSQERLRVLQARLRDARLYSGEIDGVYGGATQQAILDYEARLGLPSSGLATEKLLELLGGAAERRATTTGALDVPLPVRSSRSQPATTVSVDRRRSVPKARRIR